MIRPWISRQRQSGCRCIRRQEVRDLGRRQTRRHVTQGREKHRRPVGPVGAVAIGGTGASQGGLGTAQAAPGGWFPPGRQAVPAGSGPAGTGTTPGLDPGIAQVAPAREGRARLQGSVLFLKGLGFSPGAAGLATGGVRHGGTLVRDRHDHKAPKGRAPAIPEDPGALGDGNHLPDTPVLRALPSVCSAGAGPCWPSRSLSNPACRIATWLRASWPAAVAALSSARSCVSSASSSAFQ